MAKLSDSRVVNAFRPDPSGRDIIHFDDKIPGLGVRVKPSGVKSWLLKYRNKHGDQRRYTLGRAGVNGLEPFNAREEAIKLKAAISNGADPSANKRSERVAITVSELCDQYLEDKEGQIKASTLAMDRSRIARHVKPLLGTRRVASLTPSDIEKFIKDVKAGKSAPKESGLKGPKGKRPRGGKTTGGPGAASRTYGMLRTILQRAVRDKTIVSNPARDIEKAARPKDQVKRPPFSLDAVESLGVALREMEADAEDMTGLRAIRFLLLTGCRRMEALTLQWETVDRQARCLRFKDTKSGAQIRPIGRATLKFLASFRPLDAKESDFVFPGNSKSGHFVGLPKVWGRVAARAGIKDVSIHSLRHWFASAATELNYSELTIAGLLGHRIKGVTARYATAPDTALLAAVDRVSLRLDETLTGRKKRHFRIPYIVAVRGTEAEHV